MIVFSSLLWCILHPELDPNLLHVSVLVSVQETLKILQSHYISNPLFVVVCRFFSREKPFGLFTDSEPAAGSCCGTWTSMLLLNVWEKLWKAWYRAFRKNTKKNKLYTEHGSAKVTSRNGQKGGNNMDQATLEGVTKSNPGDSNRLSLGTL